MRSSLIWADAVRGEQNYHASTQPDIRDARDPEKLGLTLLNFREQFKKRKLSGVADILEGVR